MGAAPEPIAIAAAELSKRFDRFTVLDRLSLEVARGRMFGPLGPNGAGKSSTIKIPTPLLDATSGTASIAGYVPQLIPADAALRYPSRGTGDGATGRRFHNVRIPRHQSHSAN